MDTLTLKGAPVDITIRDGRIHFGGGGTEIDLRGCLILPGLINAHDHLEFNLFPRLGRGPYPNATAWAEDIYRPEESPVRELLQVPKQVRLWWGGIKNLLSGVTSVLHHNPYDEETFGPDFPVRVIRNFGWAHSLRFAPDLAERCANTPQEAPFVVHACEGTDAQAREEIYQLDAMGALRPNTVLVHGVALDTEALELVRRRGVSLVWCPSSNEFTLGRTISPEVLGSGIPIALGTDSAMTAAGDLAEELCIASRYVDAGRLHRMVTTDAARILRLTEGEGEIREGVVADLVVVREQHLEMVMVGGRVRLVSERLAPLFPTDGFHPLELEGRGRWLVDADLPRLRDSAPDLRLAGRRVAEPEPNRSGNFAWTSEFCGAGCQPAADCQSASRRAKLKPNWHEWPVARSNRRVDNPPQADSLPHNATRRTATAVSAKYSCQNDTNSTPRATGPRGWSARMTSMPVVVLYPHSRCNCRCLMCDIWKDMDRREISLSQLNLYLEDFARLGVRWVVLSGGEPLMHSGWTALCDALRARGLRVTILSTGILFERDARALADSVDDLVVSLDGPPLLHDQIRRVPGAFGRLARGVDAIRAIRPEMPIAARCTVQRSNFRELRETAREAHRVGLSSISFLAADLASDAFNRPGGWTAERQSEIALTEDELPVLEAEIDGLVEDWQGTPFLVESHAKLQRIVRHYRAHLGLAEAQSPVCNAPWVSAVIESDGAVRPCFFHPAYGNATQTGLLAVINGPQAVAFRESLDVASNPVCRRCVCSLNFQE